MYEARGLVKGSAAVLHTLRLKSNQTRVLKRQLENYYKEKQSIGFFADRAESEVERHSLRTAAAG